MNALKTLPVAATESSSLSLHDLLRALLVQGQLQPLAQEALAQKLIRTAAEEAGLAVSDAELQRAADLFRRRHGLMRVEQAQHWLRENGLALEDLESALEQRLLAIKFRRHLADVHLEAHFAAHRERYARARLSQVLVASESEARELRSQILDEGREFAEAAREHSLDAASRPVGGRLGALTRAELPAAVAQVVFAAREGDVVGPLGAARGFILLQVEGLTAAELNEPTRQLIRQELFAAWLRERLRTFHLEAGWLEPV